MFSVRWNCDVEVHLDLRELVGEHAELLVLPPEL